MQERRPSADELSAMIDWKMVGDLICEILTVVGRSPEVIQAKLEDEEITLEQFVAAAIASGLESQFQHILK